MTTDMILNCWDKSLNHQITNVDGDFTCAQEDLTTLESGPKRVSGMFTCYNNYLTTLEGAPEEVGGDFICNRNDLVSLKGCPKHIGGSLHASENPKLEDISDMPSDCKAIHLNGCQQVKVFTKEITTEDGCLIIGGICGNPSLLKRIKEWPYYDVLEINFNEITVRIKSDNVLFMDSL